ncbi:MAG: NfeD family protein [Clostridia bacterium]|nr:NfeD family protein [Clostridia bacterium]
MIDMMLYVWIVFFILSVIVELSTMSLVAIWFMPATAIAIVLSLFSVKVWIQVLVWFILSTLTFILTARLAARLRHRRIQPTNADRVIGLTALVTEPISDRNQTGMVKVMGQIWSARTDETTEEIPLDTEVRVLRIEGVKLIVAPLNKPM